MDNLIAILFLLLWTTGAVITRKIMAEWIALPSSIYIFFLWPLLSIATITLTALEKVFTLSPKKNKGE